jgi:peptidoglycan/xylan/chitin deacetylase (PgdA/CDA1 family)
MKVPILCYHKVGTEEAEGRRLNIHPHRLESHVRYFLRRGHTFFRASDLKTWPSKLAVCFTFDDGYESTFANGQPIFDRYGVPMSVYAVSNQVGLTSEWDGEHSRPLAGWEVLKDSQSKGHEIGNHTAHHVFLGRSSEEVQRNEVSECRSRFEANGIRSGSFCYPFGSLNESSPGIVKSEGYEVGMALGKTLATEIHDRLRLPRIVMAYGDALPLLIYKLRIKPAFRKSV